MITNLDIEALLDNTHFTIIPLVPTDKGPLPAYKGWRSLTTTPKIADKNHIGIALRPEQLVIDVDPRNGGNQSIANIEILTGINFSMSDIIVKTNGNDGGAHYYFSILSGLTFSLSNKKFPGVDFISHGRFVRAPGCLRTNGNHYEYSSTSIKLNTIKILPPAPQKLIEFIKIFYSRSDTKEEQNKSVVETKEAIRYDLQVIKNILQTLDPIDYRKYESWRDLLFSTHYACQGSEEGRQAFIHWSIQDPQYRHDASKIQTIWSATSYENNQGITDRTLLARYRENGGNLNMIVAQTKLEPLTVEDKQEDDLSYYESLTDWVYIADLGAFMSKRTGIIDDVGKFNLRFTASNLGKANPSKIVLQGNLIDSYHCHVYEPSKPDIKKLRLKNGNLAYNVYQSPNIKQIEGDITPYLNHINYMFPDKKEQHIVLSFISHLFQKPGDKIMWMLVIQSDHKGIGKTEMIGGVLYKLLGKINIVSPTTKNLNSEFNGWAENKQLINFEEIMGLGRREIVNTLKTLITEKYLLINRKHLNRYRVPNIANYISFTNYRDALKLDYNARRFAIITTVVKPKSPKYYEDLIEWISKNTPQLYYYFLNYKYDPRMMKSHAPKTLGRELMIEESIDDLEYDIKHMIKANIFPFTNKIINPHHVRDNIRGVYSTRKIIKALASVGYIEPYRPRDRSNKNRISILTKPNMTEEEKSLEYVSYQQSYANNYSDML